MLHYSRHLQHQQHEAEARLLLKRAISTAQAAQEEMKALRERNGVAHHANIEYQDEGEDDDEVLSFRSTYSKNLVPAAPASGTMSSYSLAHRDKHDNDEGRPWHGRRRAGKEEESGEEEGEEQHCNHQQDKQKSSKSTSRKEEQKRAGRGDRHRNDGPHREKSTPISRSSSPTIPSTNTSRNNGKKFSSPPSLPSSSSLLTMKQQRREAKLRELKARVERLLLREEHVEVVEGEGNDEDGEEDKEVKEQRQTNEGRCSSSHRHSQPHTASQRRNVSPPPSPARPTGSARFDSSINCRPSSSEAATVSTPSASTFLERALAAKRLAKLLSSSTASASFSSSSTSASTTSTTTSSTFAASRVSATAARAPAAMTRGQASLSTSKQSWQQESTASSTHHDAWVWPRLTEEEMRASRRKEPLRPSRESKGNIQQV